MGKDKNKILRKLRMTEQEALKAGDAHNNCAWRGRPSCRTHSRPSNRGPGAATSSAFAARKWREAPVCPGGANCKGAAHTDCRERSWPFRLRNAARCGHRALQIKALWLSEREI